MEWFLLPWVIWGHWGPFFHSSCYNPCSLSSWLEVTRHVAGTSCGVACQASAVDEGRIGTLTVNQEHCKSRSRARCENIEGRLGLEARGWSSHVQPGPTFVCQCCQSSPLTIADYPNMAGSIGRPDGPSCAPSKTCRGRALTSMHSK